MQCQSSRNRRSARPAWTSLMPFSRATAADTKGSLPIISSPKPLARLATSSPMRPSPRCPASCAQLHALKALSPLASVHRRVGIGSLRAKASISPIVSSATARHLAPGVFITQCRAASPPPHRYCPRPHRPGRSRAACARKDISMSSAAPPSAPPAHPRQTGQPANPPAVGRCVSTSQPGSAANTASVAGDTFSARTIFILSPLPFPPSYSSKRMPSFSHSISKIRTTATCGLPSPFRHTWSASWHEPPAARPSRIERGQAALRAISSFPESQFRHENQLLAFSFSAVSFQFCLQAESGRLGAWDHKNSGCPTLGASLFLP